MTINLSDNSPRISYTVAESVTQTSFTVPFEFFADADLNVYVDGTLKTLTTDYTTTGGDGSTGSITMSVTGASGGSTVVITRDIAIERTTDFPTSGPFNIASLNTELDRLTAVAADLEDLAGRGVKLADFDTQAALTLPLASDRPNKVLAFNSAGDALVTQELGTWRGDWTTATQYYERDLVRDNNRGDVYIVNTAHVSTGSSSDLLSENVNASYYDVVLNSRDFTAYNLNVDGSTDPIYGGFKVINGVPARFTGDVQLGNDTNDVIEILGRVESDIRPRGTQNIGSAAHLWEAFLGNNMVLEQNATVKGDLEVRSNTTLGDANTDTVTINAKINTNVIPSGNNSFDLGEDPATGNRWDNIWGAFAHFGWMESPTIRNVSQIWSESGASSGLSLISQSTTNPLHLENIYGPVEFELGNPQVKIISGSSERFKMYYSSSATEDWQFTVGAPAVAAMDWTIQTGNTGVDTVLHGNLDIDGVMNIDGTTDSIGLGSGALIVDGGVSIAKALHVNTTGEFGGNVIVGGNLTVNGTTTTINSTNVTTNDTLIELAKGTIGAPSNDTGIVIERGDQDNAFIGFDESENKFKVGTGTFTGASTGNLTITTGTLVANIEGNITGNLDGIVGGTTPAAGSFTTVSASTSITGNLTGDVTGDVKATNGTVVLNSGTNGTDATITADVTGDLNGNLTATSTETKSLFVTTDSTYNIGDATNKYANIYVDDVHCETIYGNLIDTVYTNASASGNIYVAGSNGGIQKLTLSGNTSIYMSNMTDGESITLMVSNSSGYSLSFPNNPEWVNNNGTLPTLKTSGWNVITIWRASGYYAAVVGAA